MSHEQKISQANPGLVSAVLDDSGSTADFLPGTNDPVFKWIEHDFGAILHELLQRSTEMKGDNTAIKRRYYLSVTKYGSRPQKWGDDLMDIETAAEKFTDEGNSIGMGGRLGGTDTLAAMQLAFTQLEKAVKDGRFRNSFPPILFHLTDGMSHTDALPVAKQISQLATTDGNVLVVNGYIGTKTDLRYSGPEDFPGYVDISEVGSNSDNQRLFEMSSVMPSTIEENLKADGIFPCIRPNSRLFFDVRTKDMLRHVVQIIGSMESRMER